MNRSTTQSLPLAVSSWDEAEYGAIRRVVESGRFTMGPAVEEFEREFARHFGSRFAVMVNSGSSANLLAVSALLYHPDPRMRLRAGDEVIVPAVSWSTSYFPFHQCGLKLRFVDVDRQTLNLDLERVPSAITERTRAILAVSLLGNPLDFAALRAIAETHRLLVIEDNAEAMGARHGERFTGSFGICGTFSTFFSHHISTMEGGVVITDDEPLYHILLSLRAHGWAREQPAGSHLALQGTDAFTRQFRFVLPGYNVRPLELSGAIGLEQLKKLHSIVEKRRENALVYQQLFGGVEHVRPQREVGSSSWFGFALCLQGSLSGRRSEVVGSLSEHGIESRPIVAGNFLNNPVTGLLDYTVAGSVSAADDVDRNGLFIGNHHYDISPQLQRVRELIDDCARRL